MITPVESMDSLKDLLKRCTASVRIDGSSRGAAFFVDNSFLLTCAHVVKDAEEVEIVPYLRSPRKARVVIPNHGVADDLALLRTHSVSGEDPQPAALLDARLYEDNYFLVGYPVEEGQKTAQEGFTVTGHSRDDAGVPTQLQFEAGKQITFGMSGGPALSTRSGAVVAIVRSAKDPTYPLGGGGIPVSIATDRFPELKKLVEDPPVAVREWRDTLGTARWEKLGLTWDMERSVDLSVSGTRNKWCIKSEVTSADGEILSAANLGDEGAEAIFQWAQRRRVSAKQEVKLLGGLLEKALFPKAVKEHFTMLSAADRLTVRLHIDQKTGLADIPWELACVPGRPEEFLAAHPTYRFIRVIDEARKVSTVPRGTVLKVLGVIGLPGKWKYTTMYGEQSYKWPALKDILASLKSHFASSVYNLKTLVNPTPSDVHTELDFGGYDILHYVGVGQIAIDGHRAQLSMVEAFAGGVSWLETVEMLEWAAKADVRLAVIQLTGPPTDQRLEPVSPSSLGEVFRKELGAVVLTRFPVHPAQLHAFNIGFYRQLGLGSTIPHSVQEGRRRLREDKGVDDAAGFGWFALTTGPCSDIRLLPPRASSSEQKPHTRSDESESHLEKQSSEVTVRLDKFLSGNR